MMAIPSDGPSEGGGANAVEVQARRQIAKAEEVEERLQWLEADLVLMQQAGLGTLNLEGRELLYIATLWLIAELREALR
jgi:hypothetical protein